MKTNTILALLQRLRDRLSPKKYIHPILQSVDLDVDTRAKQSLQSTLAFEAELTRELTETRAATTAIMENLVKRSEAERRRLELIFDSLDDAVLLVDGDEFKLEAANRAARRLFGLQTSELLNSDLELLLKGAYSKHELRCELEAYKAYLTDTGYVSPKDGVEVSGSSYADLQALYSSYVRTQHTLIGTYKDFEFLRQDGVKIPARVVLNMLTLDPYVADFNYLIVVQDLTESRRAAAEVSMLQSFTSNLMSVTPIPIFNKDSQLRFTFVNSPFKDLVQLTEADILGKSVAVVFDADSASILTELDERALASNETQQAEFTLRTAAGTVREVKVFTRALKTGELTAGVTGSIVLRSNMDESIRSSVFEAAAKAIIFFDSNLIATGCNDEFLRMSGLSKAEVIGTSGHSEALKLFVPSNVTVHVSDLIALPGGKQFCRVCSPVVNAGQDYEGLICVYFVHIVQG